MMISRIQSFIGYCLQFHSLKAHAMILLLDALRCIWRPCNGETGTQHSERSLCAVLCVVMLTFRFGLGYDFLLALMKGVTGHVLWTWLQAPSQESPSLLTPPPYSMQCRHTCVNQTILTHTKNRQVFYQ